MKLKYIKAMELFIEFILNDRLPATEKNIEEEVFTDMLHDEYHGDNNKSYKVQKKRVYDRLNEWKIIRLNDQGLYEFYDHLKHLVPLVNGDSKVCDVVSMSIFIIDTHFNVYISGRDKEMINDVNAHNDFLGGIQIAFKTTAAKDDHLLLIQKEIEKEAFFSKNEGKNWTENDIKILKSMCCNTEPNMMWRIRHELKRRPQTIYAKIKELKLPCGELKYPPRYEDEWKDNEKIILAEIFNAEIANNQDVDLSQLQDKMGREKEWNNAERIIFEKIAVILQRTPSEINMAILNFFYFKDEDEEIKEYTREDEQGRLADEYEEIKVRTTKIDKEKLADKDKAKKKIPEIKDDTLPSFDDFMFI